MCTGKFSWGFGMRAAFQTLGGLRKQRQGTSRCTEYVSLVGESLCRLLSCKWSCHNVCFSYLIQALKRNTATLSSRKKTLRSFQRSWFLFINISKVFLPPALINVASKPWTPLFSLQLQESSKLNRIYSTLMQVFGSHFRMHYIRERLLI